MNQLITPLSQHRSILQMGKPSHSWRVAILPYIGQQKLYDQYNFDQPWDRANNIGLLGKMPQSFGCPANCQTTGHTPYNLIAGKGTTFEPGRTNTFATITDGSSNSIGIVKDVSNPVPCTKPPTLPSNKQCSCLHPKAPEAPLMPMKVIYSRHFVDQMFLYSMDRRTASAPRSHRISCAACACVAMKKG